MNKITMENITDVHNKAMRNAELAFLAKVNGDRDKFIILSYKALELEIQAIELLSFDPIEPSYSILINSAIALSNNCKDEELKKSLDIYISKQKKEELK